MRMTQRGRALRPKRGAKPTGQSAPRLAAWLGLAGALVAASAAISVAAINKPAGSTAATPLPTNQKAVPAASPAAGNFNSGVLGGKAQEVAITNWSESPDSPPPGEHYKFSGTVYPTPSASSYVFVINYQPAQPTRPPDLKSTQWVVSPPATISGTSWTVNWDFSTPPPYTDWTAIVVDPPVTPAPGTKIAGTPKPGVNVGLPTEPPEPPTQIRQQLALYGFIGPAGNLPHPYEQPPYDIISVDGHQIWFAVAGMSPPFSTARLSGTPAPATTPPGDPSA